MEMQMIRCGGRFEVRGLCILFISADCSSHVSKSSCVITAGLLMAEVGDGVKLRWRSDIYAESALGLAALMKSTSDGDRASCSDPIFMISVMYTVISSLERRPRPIHQDRQDAPPHAWEPRYPLSPVIRSKSHHVLDIAIEEMQVSASVCLSQFTGIIEARALPIGTTIIRSVISSGSPGTSVWPREIRVVIPGRRRTGIIRIIIDTARRGVVIHPRTGRSAAAVSITFVVVPAARNGGALAVVATRTVSTRGEYPVEVIAIAAAG